MATDLKEKKASRKIRGTKKSNNFRCKKMIFMVFSSLLLFVGGVVGVGVGVGVVNVEN